MILWSTMNEAETIRLNILPGDGLADSPRDWDNVGTIVTWHRRYELGDEQPSEEPRQWAHEWKRGRKESTYLMLPVFMYEHSGIALSTGGFSCPWDSGQVGYVYATRERADELGIEWDEDKIREILIAEIEVYSQYLNGEVYGFEVERLLPCGHWEHDDSCFGFYGSEWDKNGMADHLPDDARPLLEEI